MHGPVRFMSACVSHMPFERACRGGMRRCRESPILSFLNGAPAATPLRERQHAAGAVAPGPLGVSRALLGRVLRLRAAGARGIPRP